MEIRVIQKDVTAYDGEALVVNLFQGVEKPGGATGAVDQALGGAIGQLIRQGEIKGKRGERTLIHTLGKLPAARVLVAGLGKQGDFTVDRARTVTAEAVKHLRRIGCRRVGTIVHGAGVGGLDPAGAAQALAEGALLGLYRFDRYKKADDEERPGEIETLEVLERDPSRVPVLAGGVERGQVLAEATNWARDLVNEPGNTLTPTELANRIRAMAGEAGLDCRVLDRPEMEELGMGGLLGVAQGSAQPPKMVILRHPGGAAKEGGPHLGLVGKGITFDSGGISIKPADGMEAMKGDMAGAAAVAAAMRAIAALRLPVRVTGVIAASENLPSGTSYKPGDILRAMNGTTMEIINTDAEGRLVLADALCYARKLGVTHLVDLATLTRACIVALGTLRSGAFGNDRAWTDQVLGAGEEVGEKMWQMPMDEEYGEQIKSAVADIKNVGERGNAGSIAGAMFLRQFVEDTPWVHLDIAGTAEAEKEKGYQIRGATGVGTRTLIRLAMEMSTGEKEGS